MLADLSELDFSKLGCVSSTPLPRANTAARTTPLLDSLLYSDAQLAAVAKRAATYELQIIYTQIDRDEKNQPHFTQHNFRLNPRQYFDPASLVKLPTAVLALEKLNSLRSLGVTRNSPMVTGIAYRCQTAVPYVATADSDYQHSVGNYIKRMLLASDNNAYNRLYEFVGQRPLNEHLWNLGYSQIRIVRRFAPCDTAANRCTNPISFYDANSRVLYKQPAAINSRSFSSPLGHVTKGKAYKAGGKLIHQPYDFTTANYLPLQDITDILKTVMFPFAVPKASRFNLPATDYQFLRYYLHSTPHGSGFKPYSTGSYFDTYKKYLYYGRNAQIATRPELRIYNIVGMSHGYLADIAYFADSTHHTEFLLSCALYVNQDGVINDGVYEYTTVGLPFLRRLGQVIYQYDIKRLRRYQPNLREIFFEENFIRKK
ncbi:hypothetical protein GCM10011383_16440 [Hymenobacter cavernae]|uniref:Beta-lactamase class A catalytic domain-containing protein n=2 Tax=Hymenobacter cavernae TaxID=2044852 RepID=A0ABQ1TXB7_9BACT|nr:hypothetical protein GCM10011383_16440 [Hymenobacter cavernae]